MSTEAFVTILDDMGCVVALAGPFPSMDEAEAWAENHTHHTEAYTALQPVNPSEYED